MDSLEKPDVPSNVFERLKEDELFVEIERNLPRLFKILERAGPVLRLYPTDDSVYVRSGDIIPDLGRSDIFPPKQREFARKSNVPRKIRL